MSVGMKSAGATYVYVSNAHDGDIGLYVLKADGSLEPRSRIKADQGVMPMAVRPDKRMLVAVVRGKTTAALSYEIDPATGALKLLASAPLVDGFPYIAFDRSGRFLLGAAYSAALVGVYAVGADGRVGEAVQIVPTARNAHSIGTDNSNRFSYVPHLGTDQVFQFAFDEKTGRLTAITPPVVQLKQGSGPRHFVTSSDNRFIYLLNELTATITTLALDSTSGLLSEVSSVGTLPPESGLVPGAPRGVGGVAGGGRDVTRDIWASDIHITPDGRFIYAAERTGSTITALGVDGATGKLTYLSSIATEKQPRGFQIDPTGRFIVVSGEKSETISSYAIDAATGALRLVGKYATGKGANWVEIVSFG